MCIRDRYYCLHVGLISFPVSQLEEDIPSAGIEAFAGSNDTEGGTGYPEEEYVPV